MTNESKLPMLLSTIKESVNNINEAIKEHENFCKEQSKEQYGLDLSFIYDLNIIKNDKNEFDYFFSFTCIESRLCNHDPFNIWNPLTMNREDD